MLGQDKDPAFAFQIIVHRFFGNMYASASIVAHTIAVEVLEAHGGGDSLCVIPHCIYYFSSPAIHPLIPFSPRPPVMEFGPHYIFGDFKAKALDPCILAGEVRVRVVSNNICETKRIPRPNG